MLQDVVDRHHVRVAAQHRRVAGLGAGARDPRLVLLTPLPHIAEPDLLERHVAVEPLVVGEPDVAHPAGADLLQKQIPAVDDPAHSRLR